MKLQNSQFLLTLLFVYFIVIGVFLAPITATNIVAEGVSISPARSILNTLPGQNLEVKYSILNNTKSTKTFRLQPAQILGDSILTDATETNIEWIKFQNDSFTLNPNSQTEISFNIEVTPDASEGVYRFLLIAQEVTPSNLQTTGTGVNMAIGYGVEVNVLETLPQGNLETFLQVTPSFNIDNRFEITATLKNAGNINIYPVGYLKVFSPKGDVVFQEVINDRQLKVAPKDSLVSEYKFNVGNLSTLDAVGSYTAEIVALEPALALTSKASHIFLHIPWLIFAIILVVVALLLLLANKFLKKLLLNKKPTK